MKTNLGGTLPEDDHAKVVNLDIERDMIAFDQLTPEAREALRAAPVNIAATSLLQLQERLGEEAAARIAQDRIATLFPGYRPI